LKSTEDRLKYLKVEADIPRENAHKAGKEGYGTHRNAGDSGRVAALWVEKIREIKKLEGEM